LRSVDIIGSNDALNRNTNAYSRISQTVVRRPQVVLGFCPCGPFRLNISPQKTDKIKLT